MAVVYANHPNQKGAPVRWYPEVRAAVKRCMPFLLATQGVNLALLVRAILIKRSLCQTELARTYPRPFVRQVDNPKHDLLHRLKRLSRFLANDQVDPLQVQIALLPYTLSRLGHLVPLRRVGLCID